MSFNATKPNNSLPSIEATGLKNEDFTDLLLKAQQELSELKGYTLSLPDPKLLVSPLAIRESVESSSIENINTTVVDVLKNQLIPEEERTKADKEAMRYTDALDWGYMHLDEFSLTTRLMKGTVKKLIPASGGEYRNKQNHIVNSATGELIYTPPSIDKIPPFITEWELFANEVGSGALHPLIRAALAHYQFEAIHPFDDGNGRTGRILMVLQLVRDGILNVPILYISSYINKNKSEYYRLLQRCNETQDYKPFVEFMLRGFHLQALETKRTLLDIMGLFYAMKTQIKTELPKIYSADLVEHLFTSPIISPKKLAANLKVHRVTASKYLQELQNAGILEHMKYKTYHLYFCKRLLDTLKGDKR